LSGSARALLAPVVWGFMKAATRRSSAPGGRARLAAFALATAAAATTATGRARVASRREHAKRRPRRGRPRPGCQLCFRGHGDAQAGRPDPPRRHRRRPGPPSLPPAARRASVASLRATRRGNRPCSFFRRRYLRYP
jgi:hypothetical protein